MSRGQTLGRVRKQRIRGRVYYIAEWYDLQGKRERRHFSDRETAQRILVEEVRRREMIKAGLGSELGQSIDIVTLAAAYLAELGTRTTAKHVQMTARELDRLPGILGARQVRDLRPENYEAFRQAELKRGVARATVNRSLVALNGMLRWAHRTRRIAENPLSSLRVLPTGPAYQKRPRRALDEDETEAFLRAAYAADKVAEERVSAVLTILGGTKGEEYAARERLLRVPQAVLFRTLIETGARWGELRQVTWADLDLTKGRMTLRPATTKNRRGRVVPVKPSLGSELRGLLDVHHRVLQRAPTRADPVFLTPQGKPWREDTANIRRILKPILKAAGIEPVNEQNEHVDIHALRHTAATRLARAGMPMPKLQAFLGHRDVRTSMRYYDHLQVEDLEVALELVPDVCAAVR